MKIERIQNSIELVKFYIKKLESKKQISPIYYVALEHEKTVLYALEKQVPKRPIEDGYYNEPSVCPNCGCNVINGNQFQYCNYCGQKLDWSEHPIEKGGAKE